MGPMGASDHGFLNDRVRWSDVATCFYFSQYASEYPPVFVDSRRRAHLLSF